MPKPRIDTLAVDDLAITVRYSNTERITIRVRPPHGEVRVSAPHYASKAEVTAFVASKMDWIKRAQSQFNRPDDGFWIWGLRFRRQVRLTNSSPRISIVGDEAIIETPSVEQLDRTITNWRKEELASELTDVLDYWQTELGLVADKITLRKMSSRWGSCNHQGRRLTFNTHLTEYPVYCLEYVVVHELVHLEHPNHSKQFWKKVSAALPDWKERRLVLSGKTPRQLD